MRSRDVPWQRERKARQRREALADLPPMDEDEFMRCLEAAVREGKVPAVKLWDEISRRKAAERVVSPFDALDEFEQRDASWRIPSGTREYTVCASTS